MTEAEWLNGGDPLAMSGVVWSETRTRLDRRLARFGVAICERVRPLIRHPAVSALLDRACRAADGGADPTLRMDGLNLGGRLEGGPRNGRTGAEWQVRRTQTESAEALASVAVPLTINGCFSPYGSWTGLDMGLPVLAMAAVRKRLPGVRVSIDDVFIPDRLPADPAWRRAYQAERDVQAALLRDITGNPFRPVAADPTWRTSTAVALAAAIHDGRAFDRMPVLADALEEAGCDNADALAHCRGALPHVRGCWVIDLLLNKQ